MAVLGRGLGYSTLACSSLRFSIPKSFVVPSQTNSALPISKPSPLPLQTTTYSLSSYDFCLGSY